MLIAIPTKNPFIRRVKITEEVVNTWQKLFNTDAKRIDEPTVKHH